MKTPSTEELRQKYRELSTEELFSLFQQGNLTDEAQTVARKELASRGIPAAELNVTPLEETAETYKGNAKAPLSVQIIARLFILLGILSVLDMARWYLHAPGMGLYINLGIIGFFVGPGLLKGVPAWRKVAMIAIVLGLIASVVATVVTIALPFYADAPINATYSIVSAILGGSLGFLFFWAYRVLRKPEIMTFFSVVDVAGKSKEEAAGVDRK